MADKTLIKVLPPMKVVDNGDGTWSIQTKDVNSDAILANFLIQNGLAYRGTITEAINVTTCRISAFIGYGSTYFRNWYMYVVWDAQGLGAAPQDEWRLISAFNSADATFTHAVFTAQTAVGDKVLLLHPAVAYMLGLTPARAGYLDELAAANIPADVDAILVLANRRLAGRTQSFTRNITSAANAGAVTVATVTTQACKLKSVVVRANAAQTADLTSVAITCGAGGVVTIIDAIKGLRANIAAQDQQVSEQVEITLPVGATIVITLVGTGAGAVNLQIDLEGYAITDGGYLA